MGVLYKNNTTLQYNNRRSKQVTMNVSKAVGSYVKKEPVSQLFSIPKDFIIKNDKWFGGGESGIVAEILVPTKLKEDEVMYRMVCFDAEYDTGGDFKGCKVVLKNLQGKSVLIFTNYIIAGAAAVELLCPLNIHENDYQSQLATATPLCRVHRKFDKLTIHNRYEIEMLEQASRQNHYENIDCVGKWPKKIIFVARKSRQELAFGERNLVNNGWKLHVEAGEDALLFIGIACAIDRISKALTTSTITDNVPTGHLVTKPQEKIHRFGRR